MSNAQALAEIRTLYELLHDVNARLQVLERNEQPLSAQIPPGDGLINQLLRHDGSAPDWVAFDWDLVAAAAGADMAHSHESAGEGGQIAVAALSDHNKANHDSLNINAGQVDGVDLPGTIAQVLSDHNKANHDSLGIDADTVDGQQESTLLRADGSRTGASSQDQKFTNAVRVTGDGIYLGRDADPGVGNVAYTGVLKSYKNATEYAGYAFVPLTTPLTSTSWDGDAFSSVGTATQLDLSAVFGAPAGIKAVLLQCTARDSAAWGTGDLYVACGPSSTYWYAYACRTFGGDVWSDRIGPVPCDSNGDVWYRISASGTNTIDIYLRIWGYWI